MKVKIKGEAKPALIPMYEMVRGQIARIVDTCADSYNGSIVLRSEKTIVDLKSHHVDWCMTCTYKVELLPAGTVIELTVE